MNNLVKYTAVLLCLTGIQHNSFCQYTKAWVAGYAGNRAYGTQTGRHLVLDNEGYIYVAGWGETDSTDIDYILAKYSPSGSEEWVKSFKHPVTYSSDYVRGLTINNNNIYLTGSMYYPSNLGGTNYYTLKLDLAGDTVWSGTYTGCNNWPDQVYNLQMDGIENVYISGESSDTSDCSTGSSVQTVLKYDVNGNFRWTVSLPSYNSVTNDMDLKNGNIYTSSMAMWYYDSLGNEINPLQVSLLDTNGNALWSKEVKDDSLNGDYNAPYSAINESDGLYTAMRYNNKSEPPGGHGDFGLLKFDFNGNQKWFRAFDGGAKDTDWVWDMMVHNNGIYLAGKIHVDDSTGWHAAVIKYDTLGNLKWSKDVDGGFGGVDEFWKLNADMNGNILAAGRISTPTGNGDMAVVQFDGQTGEILWMSTHDEAGGDDIAYDVMVDSTNNIYVTGHVQTALGNWDMTTIKYSKTTGLADDQQRGTFFNVYPNPTKGHFTLTYGLQERQPVYLNIYNTLGQQVYNTVLSGSAVVNHTIDLSNQPKGIYFLQAGELSTKIVME